MRLQGHAATNVPAPNQSLGVELKFNYNNNVSLTQGTISEQDRHPRPSPGERAPAGGAGHPLPHGQAHLRRRDRLDVTVTFQNAGTAKLVSPVVPR